MAEKRAIFLMRHAKSSWGDAALSDHERPLNKRGRVAAPIMGKKLMKLDLIPQMILVSTALRAQQTAQAVIVECNFKGPVVSTKRLYLADPAGYFDVFTEVPEGTESVMVIGHNPGISDLAEVMTGEPLEMCTAGVAHIECEAGEIARVTAQTKALLRAYYRPPRDGRDS